jgi:CysZ protein
VSRYIWLPALLSLAIIAMGLAAAFSYTGDLAAYLTAQLPASLDFLNAILVPVIYVLSVLLGAWLFAFVAVLLVSPFLGDLAIAVERDQFGDAPRGDPSFWHGVVSAMGRELRKLGYYLPRLLVVFVLTLIPGVNAVAPFIWFGFGAWTLAVQFCDYPTENRGRPFRETLDLLRRDRAAAFGYGSCATLALAIPLLNFLIIPVAVAGGTLLHRRLAAAGTLRRDPS